MNTGKTKYDTVVQLILSVSNLMILTIKLVTIVQNSMITLT